MHGICSSYRIFLPLLLLLTSVFTLLAQEKIDEKPTPQIEGADKKLLEMMLKLASDEDEDVIQTIKGLALTGDLRLENFFDLYRQGSVYLWEDAPEGVHPVVVNEETIENDDFDELAPLTHPLSGEKILVDGKQLQPLWDDLTDISPGRKIRKVANSAKFLIRLSSPDLETRMSGVKKSGDPPQNIDAIESLGSIAKNDPDKKVRWLAKESLLLIRLANVIPDQTAEERQAAIVELGKIKSMRALPRLKTLIKEL